MRAIRQQDEQRANVELARAADLGCELASRWLGASTATRKDRNMMKAMDSARRLGANRSDTRRYREDLQRRPRVEDAVSCFDISGSQY